MTILANVTDNQARYRCEAHNSATEIPLFETTTLSVHCKFFSYFINYINQIKIKFFEKIVAPETVKIRIEPDELKPGADASLFCDSSSSNPPAKITWWRDGIPVEGSTNSSKQGLWGGIVSSSELKVNVTQEMNGVVYTCQSTNDALVRSVHEAVNLQVLCKILKSNKINSIFN